MTRFVVVLLLLLSAPLAAQERILAYDSTIQVQVDGSLDVSERIVVHADGNQVRRGIYRDFPTRYKDHHGNRVIVGFEVLGVLRDGQPTPWFSERRGNGIRINTGNDDLLPVPADYAYTLHYRVTRELGFFADHDELYWNVTGTGWDFAVERAGAEVRLPEPVPVAAMHAQGYTGAQGATGQDYVAQLPAPGLARWHVTRALAPRENLTIVLSFPKGLVAEPTRAQRIAWFLKDNRGVLVALLGWLVLFVYCVLRWRKVGRDPAKGVVIARYDPPTGHSPAALRYMQRMGYDTRCFSADLLSLAVDGALRIHREDHLLKDDWQLEKTAAAPPMDAAQRILLGKLFPGDARMLELRSTHAATISGAQAAHTSVLAKRFQPEFFRRNLGSAGIGLAILLATGALAFALSGGAGIPAIMLVMVLMVLVLGVFTVLVKAPTPAGRKLLDEIEGLKLYLGVAERDELARLPGPEAPPVLDAQRYERLLPYAVALDVEEAWTRQFTLAVGVAAAAATTAAITWYQGGHVGDLGSLTRAVGSSLSSQIASSSSAPGSSSGGGGGSSGGGGGGGGGGGR